MTADPAARNELLRRFFAGATEYESERVRAASASHSQASDSVTSAAVSIPLSMNKGCHGVAGVASLFGVVEP